MSKQKSDNFLMNDLSESAYLAISGEIKAFFETRKPIFQIYVIDPFGKRTSPMQSADFSFHSRPFT